MSVSKNTFNTVLNGFRLMLNLHVCFGEASAKLLS